RPDEQCEQAIDPPRRAGKNASCDVHQTSASRLSNAGWLCRHPLAEQPVGDALRQQDFSNRCAIELACIEDDEARAIARGVVDERHDPTVGLVAAAGTGDKSGLVDLAARAEVAHHTLSGNDIVAGKSAKSPGNPLNGHEAVTIGAPDHAWID